MISYPNKDPLSIHLREGSRAILRHKVDERHISLKGHPKLSWYAGNLGAPFNPYK